MITAEEKTTENSKVATTAKPEVASVGASDVQFSLEVISPKTAKLWITGTNKFETGDEKTSHRLNQKIVDQYAADMQNGEWVFNGDAILLDSASLVLDGLHRLQACVQANRPLRALIARNVRRDTVHTIDQHNKRSFEAVIRTRIAAAEGKSPEEDIYAAFLGLPVNMLLRLSSTLRNIDDGLLKITGRQRSWHEASQIIEKDSVTLAKAMRLARSARCKGLMRADSLDLLCFMALKAGKADALHTFFKEARVGKASEEMDGNLAATSHGFWFGHKLKEMEQENRVGDALTNAALSIIAFNRHLKGDSISLLNFAWDYGTFKRPKPKRVRQGMKPEMEPAKHWTSANWLTGTYSYPDIAKRFRTPSKSLLRKSYDTIGKDGERMTPRNCGFPELDGYAGLEVTKYQQLGIRIETDMLNEMRSQRRRGATETTDVGFEVVKISAKEAQEWLDRFNFSNRNKSRAHIEKMYRDIVRGNWQMNGQTLGFSGDPFTTEGGGKESGTRLLNGQHRLCALAKCLDSEDHADTELEFAVVYNLPEDAFSTYDLHNRKTHRPVSAKAASALSDYKKAQEDAGVDVESLTVRIPLGRGSTKDYDSALSMLFYIESETLDTEHQVKPSRSEIAEIEASHPGLTKCVKDARSSHKKVRLYNLGEVATTGVAAAIMYVTKRDDMDIADQWLRLMSFGGFDPYSDQKQEYNELFANRGKIPRNKVAKKLLDSYYGYKKQVIEAAEKAEEDARIAEEKAARRRGGKKAVETGTETSSAEPELD